MKKKIIMFCVFFMLMNSINFVSKAETNGQVDSEVFGWSESINGSFTITPPTEEILGLGELFEKYDLTYAFVCDVLGYIEKDMDEVKAIKQTKRELEQEQILFLYAEENGYGLSAEEFEKKMEEHLKMLKTAENYEEAENVYETFKTSLEQEMKKGEELLTVRWTVEKMRQEKQEAFIRGEKKGENDCQRFEEYWIYFLMKEFENPGFDLTEFREELAKAEDFYQENYGGF